jgi:hypothetical protein
MPVPASTTDIVTVKEFEFGVEITSNGLVVKLALLKVVTPPPAKDGEVNII